LPSEPLPSLSYMLCKLKFSYSRTNEGYHKVLAAKNF